MATKPESKLLPCPFCGSNDLDFRKGWMVSCHRCGCEGPYPRDEQLDHGIKWDDLTVVLWNTRLYRTGVSDGYPCPNCDGGVLRPVGKVVDGYPVDECDKCNTFSLNPVDGRERPLRMFLRALHEHGFEPGLDPGTEERQGD